MKRCRAHTNFEYVSSILKASGNVSVPRRDEVLACVRNAAEADN